MKRLEFFSNDPEMVADACKRYFVPAIISEVGFLEEEGKMTEAADLISEKIITLDDLKEKINNDYREPIVNILSTFKVMERKEAKCIIDDVVICYERSVGLLKNRQHATIARTVVDIDNNVKTIINKINEAVNKIDEKYADISKESNTLTELLLTSIRNNEAAHQAVGEFFTKIENQLVDIDSGTASTEDRFKVLEDSLSKSLYNLVPDISQKIIYECNKFFEELKKETASNNGDISRKLQSCHDRIMTYLKTNLGEKLGGQSISERIDKIDVRTDDYLREFTSAVNDNVISDPNNNMAERCKTINKYFQINYKTEWESFNEELTRKSIVTAISLFQMLSENKQLGEMMNYRCVCNPLVVAVEAEMRIRFFEEFKSYYKHNFRDVPDYKRPSVLYYVSCFAIIIR